MDPELWPLIEASASGLSTDLGNTVSLDGYAEGFAEGVAVVWEKVKDKILESGSCNCSFFQDKHQSAAD